MNVSRKEGVKISIDKSEYSVVDLDGGIRVFLDGGEFDYYPKFFDDFICERFLAYLNGRGRPDATKISWKQEYISMYGRRFSLPRLTAWYGDKGRGYTYSGISMDPEEWVDPLLFFKKKIEMLCGFDFNSVLLNWYRDGEDHLGWHSDDERELGLEPVIASLSFGEKRDFLIRRKRDISKRIVIPLVSGSVLVMKGRLQENWEHSVPKRKKVSGGRFNMTFRSIFSD